MWTQLTHTGAGDIRGEETRRTAEVVESQRVLHSLQNPRRGHDRLVSRIVGCGMEGEVTIIHLAAAAGLDESFAFDPETLSYSWFSSLLSSGSDPDKRERLPLRH